MRPIPRLLLCSALAAAVLAPTAPAVAQELPPGFTDGQPVGDDTVAPPAGVGNAIVEAAAVTQRYFGAGAYAAVRTAVAATSRPCPISDDGLTALVLAPVFKESSAATTPASAPSPMTLSRYDEWNGVFASTVPPSNNYGLYAFRNPATAYQRAFWSPGIGIWQYDTAGVGAPFTTIEAMDVGVVVADIAAGMAARYCNPAPYYDHGAPFSDQERRYAAWHPWGSLTRSTPTPCTLCQGFFNEMFGSSPRFANLGLVAGIDALGGVVRRTCALAGVPGSQPCWYVEPRVGVIQGATAWATFSPSGGSNTVAPTPLPAPFYVVDRGATEERHWLRQDTGYGVDITARRTIGRDARPRSSQPGSGLTWLSTSGLCDLTAGRGACVPMPPTGVTSAALTINAVGRSIPLDANGDGRGDVLVYEPGSAPDSLLLGAGNGTFTTRSVSINLTYDHVLPGDVDGDGDDDVLFYASATGQTFLWRSNGDGTFSTIGGLAPGPGLIPFFLNIDDDAAEELFWYGPGTRPDSVWSWTGSSFSSSARSVSGTYQPIVGDFDGNGRDDILWYAPGPAGDYLWLHKVAGGYVSGPRTILGSYRWAVGDFDGDGRDDVLWHAPGPAIDSIWYGAPGATFSSVRFPVSGSYLPVVLDLFGTGRSSIVWHAPGATGDFLWTFSASRVSSSVPLQLPSTQVAVVGAYSAGGAPGIVWYGAGSVPDVLWYR